MQETSALYQSLLRTWGTEREHRAVIGGQTYGQDRLVSCQTSRALFTGDTLAVGGCYAGQLSLSLREPGDVPRMAEIKLYTRLVNGEQASEWLPAGVYYIDTRDMDKVSGVLSLTGYDAMLKAEQVYLREGDVGQWPRSMPVVVQDICARMDVTLDSRTVLSPAYMVEYPNDYTMREILGYIGAAHGGNWAMTPTGCLRLVTLAELPPETSLLIDDQGDAILMGEVRIIV